jgi:hypothetical protein
MSLSWATCCGASGSSFKLSPARLEFQLNTHALAPSRRTRGRDSRGFRNLNLNGHARSGTREIPVWSGSRDSGNRGSGLAGIAGPGFGKSGIPGPIWPGSGDVYRESTPMRARASGISGPVQKRLKLPVRLKLSLKVSRPEAAGASVPE